MADTLTKAQRSLVMASVKSTGNRSTELRLLRLFKVFKIAGWRRQLPLPGRPDFAFIKMRIAVFVDGCFWHGCPKCCRMPRTNRSYWLEKMARNRSRDAEITRHLRHLGWVVVRIRECELRKHPERTIRKFRKLADAVAFPLSQPRSPLQNRPS